MKDSYDLIFMDAAKGQYIHFLPDVLRLLAPGGVLVSDNVLQDGEILESRYLWNAETGPYTRECGNTCIP